MADYAHSVLDLNHDGVVSSEEFGSVLAKNNEAFSKVQDVNHDEELDVDELRAMSGALVDPLRVIMSVVYSQEDLPLEIERLYFARYGLTPAKVEAADENGDGILSMAELMEGIFVQALVKLGDENGDGVLNEKEFVKANQMIVEKIEEKW